MSDHHEPIHVRPAESDDLNSLRDFLEPFVEDNRLLPRTMQELSDLIKNAFVAVSGDQIVGCAALEIYSSKLAEIRSLAVAPIFQGKGLGKQLVNACVDRARERQVLEVMAITASEDFFLSCGFDFTLPGQKKAVFLQTRDKAHLQRPGD